VFFQFVFTAVTYLLTFHRFYLCEATRSPPFRSGNVWSSPYFRTIEASDFSARGNNFGITLYVATPMGKDGDLTGSSHPPSEHTQHHHLTDLYYPGGSLSSRYWLPVIFAQSPTCPAAHASRFRIWVCSSAYGPLGSRVSFRQSLTGLP